MSSFQINSVERYLEAFRYDVEEGKRNHVFVKDEFEEHCVICKDPEAAHHKFKDCEVCYETLQEQNFAALEACGHSYCKPCLAGSTRQSILSGNYMKLRCLKQGCKEVFQDQ